MFIVHKISELQNILQDARQKGESIGLVPTMGALHNGHASLVRRSVEENAFTVVSIFLNPTQFNDKSDLEKYPRTLDADCSLLEECGAQLAFAPSVEEIYPEPDKRHFDSVVQSDEIVHVKDSPKRRRFRCRKSLPSRRGLCGRKLHSCPCPKPQSPPNLQRSIQSRTN